MKKNGKSVNFTIQAETITEKGPEVTYEPNLAILDKRKFKTILKSKNVHTIELWTDGARNAATCIDGISIPKQMGSGLHIRINNDEGTEQFLDLAWAVTGVSDILGAEMVPLAKLLQWSEPAKKIIFYTDSAGTIQVFHKATSFQYNDRELVNHPERNAIYTIVRTLKQHPEKATQIRMVKVTSHTGDAGNEAADILAGLGARRTHAAHVHIKESLPFILEDPNGNTVYGRIRKFFKWLAIRKQNARWAASPVQGLFAVDRIKEQRKRKPGPIREITADQRLTRENNSLQLSQNKWPYGIGQDTSDKWKCQLCGAQFSSAAHKIHECVGKAKDMVMATLKAKWIDIMHETSEYDIPKWVNDMCTHEQGEWRLIGDHWWHHTTLTKAADRFRARKLIMPNDNMSKEQCYEFMHMLNNAGTKLRRDKDQTPSPPDWLMRALLTIGIHTEIDTHALVLSTYTEHVASQQITPKTLEGGTFRSLIGKENMMRAWVKTVQGCYQRMDAEYVSGRHVLLFAGHEKDSNFVRSHSGRIVASWNVNTFKMIPRSWFLNKGCADIKPEPSMVYLAMWQTQGVMQSWDVPPVFWQRIRKWGMQVGTSAPFIDYQKGLLEQLQYNTNTPSRIPTSKYVPSVVPTIVNMTAWLELQQLESDKPHMFWSLYVPHLASAPPVSKSAAYTSSLPPDTTVPITVTVAGKKITRHQRIKKIKLPEHRQAREVAKQDKKKAQDEQRNWHKRIEHDILGVRWMLRKLHSKLCYFKASDVVQAAKDGRIPTQIQPRTKGTASAPGAEQPRLSRKRQAYYNVQEAGDKKQKHSEPSHTASESLTCEQDKQPDAAGTPNTFSLTLNKHKRKQNFKIEPNKRTKTGPPSRPTHASCVQHDLAPTIDKYTQNINQPGPTSKTSETKPLLTMIRPVKARKGVNKAAEQVKQQMNNNKSIIQQDNKIAPVVLNRHNDIWLSKLEKYRYKRKNQKQIQDIYELEKYRFRRNTGETPLTNEGHKLTMGDTQPQDAIRHRQITLAKRARERDNIDEQVTQCKKARQIKKTDNKAIIATMAKSDKRLIHNKSH